MWTEAFLTQAKSDWEMYKKMESAKEPVCHDIEKLAPALAAGGVNAEYPWMIPDGTVMAPLLHTFALSDNLRAKRGRDLLKLVGIAFDSFFVLHKMSRKGAK